MSSTPPALCWEEESQTRPVQAHAGVAHPSPAHLRSPVFFLWLLSPEFCACLRMTKAPARRALGWGGGVEPGDIRHPPRPPLGPPLYSFYSELSIFNPVYTAALVRQRLFYQLSRRMSPWVFADSASNRPNKNILLKQKKKKTRPPPIGHFKWSQPQTTPGG